MFCQVCRALTMGNKSLFVELVNCDKCWTSVVLLTYVVITRTCSPILQWQLGGHDDLARYSQLALWISLLLDPWLVVLAAVRSHVCGLGLLWCFVRSMVLSVVDITATATATTINDTGTLLSALMLVIPQASGSPTSANIY